MFLDPFGNLWEIFVLLPDVIFLAEIDEVNDGLSAEKEERIYDFDLIKTFQLAASLTDMGFKEM